MQKIVALLCVSFLFACSDQQSEPCSGKMISSDISGETSCPFMTKDNQGNIVLSWVKKINDSNAVMCYAVSAGKGYSFGQPIEISPSKGVYPHGENLPKIIFKPGGNIIAAWGVSNPNPKNKYSGLIYYAQSFDNGKSWSNAIPLVTDTTSYDQRYFDFSNLQNGEVGIIWLDNRTKTTKEGMTLYFAETNGKNGFQHEKAIGETCCQCCRTDLFVDSKNYIHAAYRDIINDTIRDMVHTVSFDGGKTFSGPKRISADNWIMNGCPHTGPTMTETKSGLHFAWFTAANEQTGVYYCSSTDNGQNFSQRELLSENARHPQMTTLPNGAVGIVWEETVKKDSLVFSKIVLQITNPDGQTTKQNVTADDVNAGFPVIVANDKENIVVAWVQQGNEKNAPMGQHQHSKSGQVFYKMIRLE